MRPDPLADLARRVNERWAANDRAEQDGRIALGKLLIDAKQLVPAGTWETWYKANVPGRSLGDARKCMAMARSPDPKAAREAEKRAAAEGMRTSRKRAADINRANVSALPFRAHDEGVGAFLRDVCEADCPYNPAKEKRQYAAWRKGWSEARDRSQKLDLAALREAFRRLTPKDQQEFLDWATDAVKAGEVADAA